MKNEKGNEFIQEVAAGMIPSRLVFPADGEIRARKVIFRSNYGHKYKFPSVKCNREIYADHSLEHDRVVLLEIDPLVIGYQEQPFYLEYADGGRVRRIFPDFLVVRIGGVRTVEEVKPWDKANQPEYLRRWAIERKLLERYGYAFDVQTEKDIWAEPRLSNSKRLLPYRRFPENPVLLASVQEVLTGGRSLTGQDLLRDVPGLTAEALLIMVARGHVVADLWKPLGIGNLFSLIEEKRNDEKASEGQFPKR